MITTFDYEGHTIVFDRKFSSAFLIIDGATADSCSGFVKSQLSDFALNGTLCDGRSIRLQISFRFPIDRAVLYVDGNPVIYKNAL